MSICEDDYAVTYKTDVAELRRENATLRARLRSKEEECDRWSRRWAEIGLVERGGNMTAEYDSAAAFAPDDRSDRDA